MDHDSGKFQAMENAWEKNTTLSVVRESYGKIITIAVPYISDIFVLNLIYGYCTEHPCKMLHRLSIHADRNLVWVTP